VQDDEVGPLIGGGAQAGPKGSTSGAGREGAEKVAARDSHGARPCVEVSDYRACG